NFIWIRSRVWAFLVILSLAVTGCAGPQNLSGQPAPAADRLPGNYILKLPAGTGPFPAVIIMHSCAGINRLERDGAERLTGWGYATLMVDSFGPRGFKEVCDKVDAVTLKQRAGDAVAAAEYLKRQTFIRPDSLGIIGYSHGGSTVLQVVQSEEAARLFRAAVSYYPRCFSHLDRVAAPLLILIGDKDDWTPSSLCQDLVAKLIQPELVTLKVYPGAYHVFDVQRKAIDYLHHHLEYNQAAAEDAIPRTREFFDRYLKK
ncbi:MAG: dienelactone hydrolase family protein, partial [Deltaproteobacteria bacterium]|nr:dienelactone hydrolase family protein [Deltaproteobacteria bacterium]